MVVRVLPLLAPYAQATGEAVIKRVDEHGALPDGIKKPYKTWLAGHRALMTYVKGAAEARVIDPFLDRAVLLGAYLCDNIIAAYADCPVGLDEAQGARLAAAKALRPVFGESLRDLVNVPFVQEWALVRDVLARLGSDDTLGRAVKTLGLGPDVALCQKLHLAYGDALGISGADAPDGAKQIAAWNQSFERLLIGATHLDDETPGLLDIFAVPYQRQLEQQQAATRRAKKKPAAADPAEGG